MPRSSSAIRCEVTLQSLDRRTIMRLPEDASRQLPSRGQVAVQATINGHAFQTVLEPDGSGGHWVRVEPTLARTIHANAGDTVNVDIEPVKAWPEPTVPPDLAAALEAAPQQIQDIWHDITPMARWEWVRWVHATRNPDTRQRRVEVTLSKMNNGKRRPCCFDLSACTDPELSKNGKLLIQEVGHER